MIIDMLVTKTESKVKHRFIFGLKFLFVKYFRM